VKQYAAWGVDYIKVDWCGIEYLDTQLQYGVWRDAIKEAGRPMVLSVAIAAIDKIENNKVWLWGGETGQLWRTAIDVRDEWSDMLRVFDRNSRYSEYSSPGGWNDADMLQVGNGHMTTQEYKTHFTLWSMMASPLLAGNDLRQMSDEVKSILTQPEVIAINQDRLGRPANLISQNGDLQVWSKVLHAPGQRAVVFLNRSEQPAEVHVSWSELDLYPYAWVRDVWAQQNKGLIKDGYSAQVPAHGIVLLKMRGLSRLPHHQIPVMANTLVTGYLTDQEAVPMPTLPETALSQIVSERRNIIMPSYSDVRYNLGGKCTTLTTSVSVNQATSAPESNLVFKIYGDGRLLYESNQLKYDSPPEKVTVSLKKMRVLNLLVIPTHRRSIYKQEGLWSTPLIECDN
jgi:hypothetical protein